MFLLDPHLAFLFIDLPFNRSDTHEEEERITEAQVFPILAEQQPGMLTAEACRRHGVNQPTFLE